MDPRAFQTASQGSGPLLQRDYWAVLDRPRVPPANVAQTLVEQFERFAPPHLVRFERLGRGPGALEPGDELAAHIRMAGESRVQIVHRSTLSVTIATMEGHPEAGRITFGVYPNEDGDTVFHIRSRARSGGAHFAVGFLALGEAMQTNCWSGFINRIAATVADGVRDVIHVTTERVEETEADGSAEGMSPTYRAIDTREGSG